MDEAVSSGARPHWEVSESLKSPWLEDAYIESVRLMRVFMDMDPREILENADEFFTVLECMYVVVTDGPCYFKGEDLEAWRRFHAWIQMLSETLFRDDPNFAKDWVEEFEVHVEGCQ